MNQLTSIFTLLAFILVFIKLPVYADTTLTYEYDNNGNLIRGEGKYYEYNDANKLVRIRHSDQNGAVITEYFYDYNGQRIKKVENGVTTYYIGKHYETEVKEGNTENAKYYFANGERVAKKDSSGNVSYYHSDHLGGTNALTDSNGNLVERTKYYPFGEIREGGQERFTYTGKEKDSLTEFYYFEARYYKPEFKHFTQADTISPNLYDPQDLNRYAYVRNNPLKYIDPSGHNAITNWFNTKINQSKEKAKQAAQYSAEKARQAAQYAAEKARQARQYVKDAGDVAKLLSQKETLSFFVTGGIQDIAGVGDKPTSYGMGNNDVAGSKNSRISSVAIPERIGNVDVTAATSNHDILYGMHINVFGNNLGVPKKFADSYMAGQILYDNFGEDGAVRVSLIYWGAVTAFGNDAYDAAGK